MSIPITPQKRSVDVTPTSTEKRSADVAPTSIEKRSADVAPTSTEKRCADVAPTSTGKRKRADHWTPEVGSWAVIRKDLRKVRNRLQGEVPCVVSRVDLKPTRDMKLDVDNSSVHVLYPNAISKHLNTNNPSKPLMFAVERYPLKSISPYAGDTGALEDVLKKALLHFIEGRGRALRDGKIVNIGVGNPMLGEQGLKTIKVGLMNLAKNQGNASGIPGCRIVGDGGGSGLEAFAMELRDVFQSQNQTKLAMADVGAALGTKHADWKEFMTVLASINTEIVTSSGRFRIVLAEELVFMVDL